MPENLSRIEFLLNQSFHVISSGKLVTPFRLASTGAKPTPLPEWLAQVLNKQSLYVAGTGV